jgi:hypothetical protein
MNDIGRQDSGIEPWTSPYRLKFVFRTTLIVLLLSTFIIQVRQISMKHLLTCAIILCTFLHGHGQFAYPPSQKVLAAYSAADLQDMSSDQIITLNVKGEELCEFVPVKEQSNPEIFQLKRLNGENVVLSEADLKSFNPLLYILPMQDKICGNLIIRTKEGILHMLIVKSKEIIEIETKKCYAVINRSKEAKK